MSSLRIRPEAEQDLAETKLWYERKRAGLGDDFLLCVEETLDRIQRLPTVHAPVYKDVYRAFVRRFPYVVYYRVDGNLITVLAVMHGRRQARAWQSRAD